MIFHAHIISLRMLLAPKFRNSQVFKTGQYYILVTTMCIIIICICIYRFWRSDEIFDRVQSI